VTPEVEGNPNPRARILVVDDEPSITAAVSAVLRRDGHESMTASAYPEAVALLARDRFDMVLTDLNIGDPNGLDLVRRALELDRDLAVLMLTGVDDPTVAHEAIDLGVSAYMVKPFQVNELRIAVMNGLRRRELEIAGREHMTALERAVVERTAALSSALEEIAGRESRFRSLASSSPMGILYCDAAGRCEYANAQAGALFGADAEALLGMRWLAQIGADDRDRVRENVRSVLATGRKVVCEHRVARPDGRVATLCSHVAPVRHESGRITGFVAVVEDVGPRKELEQRLQHLATHRRIAGGWRRASSSACRRSNRAGSSGWPSWISTSSSSSTTPTATRPATSSSPRWRSGWSVSRAPLTRSPGSEATSSCCCCAEGPRTTP
jgi:PAS domain S-box-containing protein